MYSGVKLFFVGYIFLWIGFFKGLRRFIFDDLFVYIINIYCVLKNYL